MPDDISEGLLSHSIKHGSVLHIQIFQLGKCCQRDWKMCSFLQSVNKRANSGNQTEIVQKSRSQLSGKAMNNFYRLLYKALGAGYFSLEALGVDRGFALQIGQADIDASQGLRDFIVQFPANFSPFILLRGKDFMRQKPQVRLHLAGLIKQENVMLLTFPKCPFNQNCF